MVNWGVFITSEEHLALPRREGHLTSSSESTNCQFLLEKRYFTELPMM